MLAELLAKRWNAAWTTEKKFQSQIARSEQNGARVVLSKPQTFMNASGEAVGSLVKFYQSAAGSLMVVVDDADLPFGEIRLRPGGGSGGHHGLESIEAHLATKEFARLRIGIGRKDGLREITGHVLGRLGANEMAVMEKILARAADQIECWLAHGLQKAMSQFNGVIEDSTNEGKKQ
jgi:PTH1 family peptidyl-tRNA hydrolase